MNKTRHVLCALGLAGASLTAMAQAPAATPTPPPPLPYTMARTLEECNGGHCLKNYEGMKQGTLTIPMWQYQCMVDLLFDWLGFNQTNKANVKST